MSVYRDNLSAIVLGDNLLPIIIIAQNIFGLSITDIAFVIYFVIAINDFLCTQCVNFKVSELVLWRKHTRCPLRVKTCCNLFVLFKAEAEVT